MPVHPGANGIRKTEPLHDVCSHAADALRTFSKAHEAGYISKQLGWRQDEVEERPSPYKGLSKDTDILW